MLENEVKAKQPERDKLAAEMAEREAKNGPIVCDELRHSVHAMTDREREMAEKRAKVNAERKRIKLRNAK